MKKKSKALKVVGAATLSGVLSSVSAFAETAKEKAQNGLTQINDGNSNDDLMTSVKSIINTVFAVIGMIAVVMIILGGISYATSQGDPGKVKKGKDTILYGIIGLVISLLAFAIVSFVLENIQ